LTVGFCQVINPKLPQTLDALPSHVITPFNGSIPPQNLLDKIARGITAAKGPNDWPHSVTATRAKLFDLACARAMEERRKSIIDEDVIFLSVNMHRQAEEVRHPPLQLISLTDTVQLDTRITSITGELTFANKKLSGLESNIRERDASISTLTTTLLSRTDKAESLREEFTTLKVEHSRAVNLWHSSSLRQSLSLQQPLYCPCYFTPHFPPLTRKTSLH
jgi:hypothetical protein